MKKFLNGGFGLAITYWGGVVVFGLIWQLGNRFIVNQYLTTTDLARIDQIELGHKAFFAISFIVTLLLLRAMIKAGFDNRTPGIWGWIGIVIAGLGVANVGYNTASLLFPSLSTPRFMLVQEIELMQEQLPQRMDAVTVMDRIELIEDDLIYFVTVNDTLPPENKPLLIETLSAQGVEGAALCVDFEGYFHGGLKTVKYEFTYENDVVLTTLTAEDCLAAK